VRQAADENIMLSMRFTQSITMSTNTQSEYLSLIVFW